MLVETPIFWGKQTENGITGRAADLRLVSGAVLRLFFTPVLHKIYPQKLNAICIRAAQCQKNVRYPITALIIMIT